MYVSLTMFKTRLTESTESTIFETNQDILRGGLKKVEALQEPPLVSLVILTHNKPKLLRKALVTIMVQDVDFQYEIIVIDSGCLDETASTVKRFVPDALYIPICNNPGFAAGNNQGVATAAPSSKWLLFLNDDLEFEDRFLQPMVDVVRLHPDAGGAGCKLVSFDGVCLIQCTKPRGSPKSRRAPKQFNYLFFAFCAIKLNRTLVF